MMYRRMYACPCRKTVRCEPRPLLSTVVRCPNCGRTEVKHRSRPDGIDRMLWNPLRLTLKLLGGRLYHCEFCRLQFYDLRRRAPSIRPVNSH